MLGFLTSFIGSNENNYNNWKKDLNNDLSAMKIQSVIRGHFIRRIYTNIIYLNKNNKYEIDAFKSTKTPNIDTNLNLELIEKEIDHFIKERNKFLI